MRPERFTFGESLFPTIQLRYGSSRSSAFLKVQLFGSVYAISVAHPFSFLWLSRRIAVAQSTSGSISGSVVDAQGAAVAGATVTPPIWIRTSPQLRNRAWGDFVVPELQAAPYTATSSSPA